MAAPLLSSRVKGGSEEARPVSARTDLEVDCVPPSGNVSTVEQYSLHPAASLVALLGCLPRGAYEHDHR